MPTGAATDTVRYTAKATGLVRARLTGRGGDWDVGVFDAKSKRSVAGSAAFGSNELAEGFVRKGQRLIVQACRERGDGLQGAAEARRAVDRRREGRPPRRERPGRGHHRSRPGRRRDRRRRAARKRRLQGLGLDLTEHGTATTLQVVLHGAADERKLRDNGFTWKVKIADLAARLEANKAADARYAASTAASGLPSGSTAYRRLPDYEFELKQLALQYPGLVKPITLNHKSWEGRDVTGIEITQNPTLADGKPVFLMMGVHHAREWPSSEHTIEFAYDLLTQLRHVRAHDEPRQHDAHDHRADRQPGRLQRLARGAHRSARARTSASRTSR